MMTTAAKSSFGAELWLAANGGALAKVADLYRIDPPQRSRGVQDVTTHDSGRAKEFIYEHTHDNGEIGIGGHYIAGSAADDLLLAALVSDAPLDFKLVEKAATGTEDLEGECLLTSYAPEGREVDGKATFAATLKVTGVIAQSPTG